MMDYYTGTLEADVPGGVIDAEATVFCHAPIRRFGLGGMGMKVPDLFGYYGCSACHAHESDMGWDDILRAVCETQMRLLNAGLIVIPR